MHLVHLIKDEERPGADAHIAPNPRLQLVLRGTEQTLVAESVLAGQAAAPLLLLA